MTLRAYYDGKVIVPQEKVTFPPGQSLVLSVECVEEAPGKSADLFRPLSFKIDAEASRHIAEDPEFKIENS